MATFPSLRPVGVVVAVVLGLGLPTTAPVSAACWWPPLDAPVVDPFRPPACAWCPGNRGLQYAATPGAEVRAGGSGTVTFSGVVAGTRYVVVAHPDGRRVTYGGLRSTTLASGDPVVARSVVGVVDRALHLGVRIGDRYVDPAPLLGVVTARARLVPLDGGPARPAPPPRLRCG